MTNHAKDMVLDLHTDVHVTSYIMNVFVSCLFEQFEIAITNSFLVIFQKIDLHKLV